MVSKKLRMISSSSSFLITHSRNSLSIWLINKYSKSIYGRINWLRNCLISSITPGDRSQIKPKTKWSSRRAAFDSECQIIHVLAAPKWMKWPKTTKNWWGLWIQGWLDGNFGNGSLKLPRLGWSGANLWVLVGTTTQKRPKMIQSKATKALQRSANIDQSIRGRPHGSLKNSRTHPDGFRIGNIQTEHIPLAAQWPLLSLSFRLQLWQQLPLPAACGRTQLWMFRYVLICLDIENLKIDDFAQIYQPPFSPNKTTPQTAASLAASSSDFLAPRPSFHVISTAAFMATSPCASSVPVIKPDDVWLGVYPLVNVYTLGTWTWSK